MGKELFDRYSILHFISGMIAKELNIPFWWWFIIHVIFEYVENDINMIKIINKIPFWPGGKPSGDSLRNNIGDQISAMLGWITRDLIINKNFN